ncbi:MAG: regulatory protein SipA [Leptolyngbyaceae cyanobacterium]
MSFLIGDRVRLKSQPPYFKTADPMPMLRPPDLISVGEVGTVLEQRPGGYWTVKFERGSFLVDEPYLEQVITESSPEAAS